MQSNPPWADRALKTHWDLISVMAQENDLPMPAQRTGWKFEELGCGHYGCVLPTEDDDIVFKLSSDPTEANFINLAGPLGWPEGIVEYYGVLELDFTYRRRPVVAIWREAAFEVGKLDPPYNYDRKDYEMRSRKEFTNNLIRFRDHAARFRDQIQRSKDPNKLWTELENWSDWAWQHVGIDEAQGKSQYGGLIRYSFFDYLRGGQKLAASLRACQIIAEFMENTYLSDKVGAALRFYLDNGFLLADVHLGNVGKVHRKDEYGEEKPWVITDPGHVLVLRSSQAPERNPSITADDPDKALRQLTPDQKRILLVLVEAAEHNRAVRLVTKGSIRETTTGAALVRKGLAKRLPDGRFEATTEGYWLGDALRIEDRQGRIPPRNRP